MDRLAQHDDGESRRFWFITGVTGFIGREFLRTVLVTRGLGDRIAVLVRPGASVSAHDRFREAIKSVISEEDLDRIEVVSGDISQPQFGLSADRWSDLTHCTHIVHLAANTSFSASLEVARHSNVSGVGQVAALATASRNNGMLARWSHVSTAYVVGNRTDQVRAGELDPGDRFRNPYEQSKNEAERFLAPFLNDYPLTIFRPSIVIGHSQTGEAGNFNTVYWAIRSYLSGQTKLYAKAATPLDLVPVDYVVDAIATLTEDSRAIGTSLYLAGGAETTVPLGVFADSVCRYLDSPLPQILNPARLRLLRSVLALTRLSRRHQRFIEQAQCYLPYFCQNPTFDTSHTEILLRGTGIRVPALDSYLPRILDYCLGQPWGRRSRMVGSGYQQRKVVNG